MIYIKVLENNEILENYVSRTEPVVGDSIPIGAKNYLVTAIEFRIAEGEVVTLTIVVKEL